MIDCNTFIGNWAFRRLRNNDAAGLLAMMDTFGITRACVASADAILYKDCHSGNIKLLEETPGHGDRFWLYATLNPAYAGWQRDLDQCVQWGFRCVRMYPHYHGYDLAGKEAASLIDAAAEAGLPVSIPGRIVDVRQRHWMDTGENLDPLTVLRTARKHPDTCFVLTEFIVNWPRDSEHWAIARDLRWYVELSRMTAALDKNLQVLVDTLGEERVLLGTGYPFKTPSPAFLKLRILDISEAAKSRIAGKNAQAIFGLDVDKAHGGV